MREQSKRKQREKERECVEKTRKEISNSKSREKSWHTI